MRRAVAASLAMAVFSAPVAAGADAGYKGGFFIRSEDGRFLVRIQNLLQFRYTVTAVDDGDDYFTRFSIPRGRIALTGHAWSEDLAYKFQSQFGPDEVELRDYYVDYGADPDTLRVRVGRFKRPFSRQQLTSAKRLLLVDRAITDRAFAAGRDLGVMVHSGYQRGPRWEWAFGVFEGFDDEPVLAGEALVGPSVRRGRTGGGGAPRERLHPAVVARVAYNHGDVQPYVETDLEGGPLRFGIGASTRADFDLDDDGESLLAGEVDAIVKAHHFTASGAFFVWTTGGQTPFDVEREATGWFVQGGYLLGDTWMPAARYEVVSPVGEDNDTSIATVGLNGFFYGHAVKWVTDVAWARRQTLDGTESDHRLRTQFQFAF